MQLGLVRDFQTILEAKGATKLPKVKGVWKNFFFSAPSGPNEGYPGSSSSFFVPPTLTFDSFAPSWATFESPEQEKIGLA